jgi:hypothetical protein
MIVFHDICTPVAFRGRHGQHIHQSHWDLGPARARRGRGIAIAGWLRGGRRRRRSEEIAGLLAFIARDLDLGASPSYSVEESPDHAR